VGYGDVCLPDSGARAHRPASIGTNSCLGTEGRVMAGLSTSALDIGPGARTATGEVVMERECRPPLSAEVCSRVELPPGGGA